MEWNKAKRKKAGYIDHQFFLFLFFVSFKLKWLSVKNASMTIAQVPQSELDVDLVKTILAEYRIHNADITLKYDATAEDLIDVIEGNRLFFS